MNIKPKSGERSSGVNFIPPAEPFRSIEVQRADAAWRSLATGNTIGFVSSCGDPADPTLEVAAREVFAEIDRPKEIRKVPLTFNGREALDTEVEGSVEGLPTKVRTVVFKRNGCLYTLSHIGLAQSFETDRTTFETFLKGFRAP